MTADGGDEVVGSILEREPVTLDLSDVDPRVGQLVGGGQLWEPCSATDIRRWVHAMDYPNPIHWDQEFAKKSKFGGIVARNPSSYAWTTAMASIPPASGASPALT